MLARSYSVTEPVCARPTFMSDLRQIRRMHGPDADARWIGKTLPEWLPWITIFTGTAASLAANIVVGGGHPVAKAVAVWPALALLIAVCSSVFSTANPLPARLRTPEAPGWALRSARDPTVSMSWTVRSRSARRSRP